ncbi:MAG: hypothetical protein IMZ64_06565, partial [Bacteroidetes bacterium]|nr:hypothetical protein [Bacteroidota bacterium]
PFISTGATTWEEVYPVGALVKTLAEVIDPLRDETLLPGSYVTIKECKVIDIKRGPRWILCEDANKNLWNIKSIYLMKNVPFTGKKGRFKILAQDAEQEKLMKE